MPKHKSAHKPPRKGPQPSEPKSRIANSQSKREEFLPTIDGPKLAPFAGSGSSKINIRFEELLDHPSSGGGGEGYVFKAFIRDTAYAIKLFKFWNVEDGRVGFSESQNNMITDTELIANLDPFFAECRAYGRIREHYKNQKHYEETFPEQLAAIEYGYLFLSAEHESELEKHFGPLEMEREEQDLGSPIRAIVKQLLTEKSIDPKVRSIRRMCSDLKTLHKIGVYPMDVRESNYRKGLLVDFGRALTEPSCVFRVLPEHASKYQKNVGLAAFDEMIEELKIKTSVRAMRRPVRQGRIRGKSDQSTQSKFMELDETGRKARAVPSRDRSKSKPSVVLPPNDDMGLSTSGNGNR